MLEDSSGVLLMGRRVTRRLSGLRVESSIRLMIDSPGGF
jgi:hypothetical protein